MNQIEYIEIEKIDSHPDNPRRDLGDLTELTDSIKTNGVMQNLTVIPWFSEITHQPADNGEMDGHYRVVIGHRRLAAAKLAGLTEVPCIVSDMDYKKQISVMLLENIQRSDLTPLEQAQGFQMMLDLGSSISEIVEDTGFSESTVRHRLKLNELDPELLAEKSAENINMFDLIKLEQITHQELKNEVLKTVGTNDFAYMHKRALETEKRMAAYEALAEKLAVIAEELSEAEAYEKVDSGEIDEDDTVCPYEVEGFDLSDYGDGYECYFTKRIDHREQIIKIYSKSDDEYDEDEPSEEEKAAEQAEKERAERYQKLTEIQEMTYKLRTEFMKNISQAKCKSVNLVLLTAMIDGNFMGDYIDKKHVLEILGCETPKDIPSYTEEYKKACKEQMDTIKNGNEHKIVAVMLYCGMESTHNTTFGHYGQYCESRKLTRTYDFLKALGYKMSEEEQKFIDGTHELYTKDEQ